MNAFDSVTRMRRLLVFILVVSLPISMGFGSELERIGSLRKNQLDESLTEYQRISSEIAAEKVPLVREVNELEVENITLRAEVGRYQSMSMRRMEELEDLREELDELRGQTEYIHSVFHEYLQNFESKLHIAEDQRLKGEVTKIRTSLGEPEMGLKSVNDLYAEILDLSVGRQEDLVGGYRFTGRGIDLNGRVLGGEIVIFGPAAYFASTQDETTGLLVYRSGTVEPGIAGIDPLRAEGVREFIATGVGEIPLDGSLGGAISMRAIDDTLVEHVQQGGPVGYAILILGGVGLLLSLIKVRDLSHQAKVTPEQVREIAQLARTAGREQALKRAAGTKGSIGEIVRAGVENMHSGAVFLEEMMLSVIARRRPQLERFMPFLSITAMAAPLLGLLGTVVGMIETFAHITVFGQGDPQALSSGISKALVTTELGLIVAIITLLLHALFARVIKSRLGAMEQVVFDFVRYAAYEETRRD